MRFFFDNCTSPVLAETLDGYIRHLDHSAHHIKDLSCGRSATDLQWIEMLAENPNDWIVITGDGRIYRNPAEKAAFRQAGLFGFVLATSYQTFPMNQRASFLLWRWPDMVKAIQLLAAPALIELPAHRTSRLRQL